MNKFLSLTAITITALTFAGPAFAEETKYARQNDLVDSYTLEDSGKLVRQIGNLRCDVTTDVKDMKISGHPEDEAVMYYIRRNDETKTDDLWVLFNAVNAKRTPRQCPRAFRKLIASDIKKINGKYQYGVASSNKTTIVNMALTNDGELTGWDNKNVVLRRSGIQEFEMNECNDRAGFSFKRYLAFAKANNGQVLKVEGDDPSESKLTAEKFASVDNFQKDQKVCQSQQSSLEHGDGDTSMDVL